MKILLGFFFDLFFGEDCEDNPKPNCEEYEFDGPTYLMDEDGNLDLKPSGTVGIPIE